MDDLAFTVKKIPGKIVMGVRRRTSNADGRNIKDIPTCWQDFFSQNMASKIPHRAKTPAMFACIRIMRVTGLENITTLSGVK
jgi:predicted transcriptional regulator YdeE